MHLKLPPGSVTPAFPSMGHAVLLLVGVMTLQASCGIIIAVFAMVFLGGPASGLKVLFNPWTLIGVNCLAIGAVLKLGLRGTRESLAEFFTVRTFSPGLLPAIGLTSLGLALVLAEADNVILQFLRFFPWAGDASPDWINSTNHPTGAFWLLVIVAPLTEEFLFRGMILRGLLTRHRVGLAVFLSALLFGIMHANLRQLFLGVTLGGVFGWWYVRTASVGPCLLGHALFNSVAFAAALFPEAMLPLVNNSAGGPVEHQPWWFTGAGAAGIGLGLWWFDRKALTPAPPVAEPPPTAIPDAEPPLLAPSLPPEPAAPGSGSAQSADSPAS